MPTANTLRCGECAFVACFFVSTVISCGPPRGGPAFAARRLTTSEQFVAKACREQGVRVRQSLDARHLACIVGPEGAVRVVTDNVAGKEYNVVEFLSFSPDGRRLAYQAVRAGKHFAVVDRLDSEAWDEVQGPILWSPDSRRFAYQAKRGGKSFVVADTRAFGPYDERLGGPMFTPDSKHIAYVATRGSSSFLVLDGREGPNYDATYYSGGLCCLVSSCSPSVNVSPDGTRIAYTVGGGCSRIRRRVLVEQISGTPTQERVLLSDRTYEDMKDFQFCGDGRRFGYFVQVAGLGWHVLTDNFESKANYEQIFNLVFSHDGKRVAHQVKTGDQEFVVVDGSPGKKYERVLNYSLMFSRDGQHFGYVAQRAGKTLVVIDNTETREYDFAHLTDLFSPDGKHTSYWASLGGHEFPVVDGVPGKSYDAIVEGPIFSPDSGHVAFAARRAGRFVVVVDGIESAEYDDCVEPSIMPPLVFDGPSVVRTLARRGEDIYSVQVRIE